MRAIFGSIVAVMLLVSGLSGVALVCIGFAILGLSPWWGVVVTVFVIWMACRAFWNYVRTFPKDYQMVYQAEPYKESRSRPIKVQQDYPVVRPGRTALD